MQNEEGGIYQPFSMLHKIWRLTVIHILRLFRNPNFDFFFIVSVIFMNPCTLHMHNTEWAIVLHPLLNLSQCFSATFKAALHLTMGLDKWSNALTISKVRTFFYFSNLFLWTIEFYIWHNIDWDVILHPLPSSGWAFSAMFKVHRV